MNKGERPASQVRLQNRGSFAILEEGYNPQSEWGYKSREPCAGCWEQQNRSRNTKPKMFRGSRNKSTLKTLDRCGSSGGSLKGGGHGGQESK